MRFVLSWDKYSALQLRSANIPEVAALAAALVSFVRPMAGEKKIPVTRDDNQRPISSMPLPFGSGPHAFSPGSPSVQKRTNSQMAPTKGISTMK